MNFIILPSLQHAATVLTASLLYNDQEIETMLEVATNGKCATCRRREAWEFVEMKTVEKLYSLLPVTVQKQVAKVIHLMHNEVQKWKEDHKFLVKHVDGRCSIYLTWKMDGTINRTETAKKLVVDDKLDKDIRFIMACTYFLENEILALWSRIKETNTWSIWKIFQKPDETRITRKGTNSAVRFWMECLQTNIMPSNDMIRDYFSSPSIIPLDIPLRISSFFHFLSWDSKENYSEFFYTYDQVHTDDFQTCLNKMDEIERVQMFRKEYRHALVVCLQWPYRSLFVKMAKKAFSSFTFIFFAYILLVLLYSYVLEEQEDFHLLKEFWQMTPDVFKDEVRKLDVFSRVKKYILETENISAYLKQFVREYFFD